MNPTAQTSSRTLEFRPMWKRLLVLILLALAAVFLTGCPVDDDAVGPVKQEPIAREKLEVRIWGREYDHGDTYVFTFYGLAAGPPFPATVRIVWHPPEGATNFRFHDDPEPEPGGPPFVFNLPVDPDTGSTKFHTVFYDGNPAIDEVHTVTIQSGGQEATKSATYGLPEPRVEADQRPAAPAGEVVPSRSTPQDDYYLWMYVLRIRPEGNTLTTDLCQDYMDLLQSDSTFFALRFPVQPPTLTCTEPYTLPVVFRGEYSPTLSLLQLGPYTRILTAPLEYRPRYHTFLENELPSTPGEHWLALGVATTPTITCPQGLDVNSGDWAFEPRFYLDLGGVEDTCADCVLPLYYCYKGQGAPPLFFSEAGGTRMSYQGWGITCLGPHALRLQTPNPTNPPFLLEGRHMAVITPTQAISFSHSLMNRGSVPVTVTLSYSSELGLNWGMYEDAAGQVPLVCPVTLGTVGPDRFCDFYAFVNVLEGTPSGPESLLITATDVLSPDLSAWTSDLLWVGDWVEPPPAPRWHRLYLPLIVRSSTP